MKATGIASVSGMTALAGCTGGGGDTTTLTLTTYGGSFEEHMESNVAEPFSEQHDNVEVNVVPYVDVPELEAQSDDPEVDVANLDDFLVFLADDDLFLDFDPDLVPNEGDQFDIAQSELDHAVNSYLYQYGLAVNDEIHDLDMIQSYSDLVEPEYEGEIAINSDWPVIMVLLSLGFGGDEFDMEPLWNNLGDLAENVTTFYSDFTDPELFLAQGNATISSWFDGRTVSLAAEDHPISFHLPPEDGGLAGRGSLVVMSETDHPELSQELVNFIVGPEVQQGYAEDMNYGPVNAETDLDSDLAENVATEDVFDELYVPDWEHAMDNIEEWNERWNNGIQ